ncbi:MAG: helicase HerA domain-containing protein, partial [Candidatus Thorarchaeota archaeon]
ILDEYGDVIGFPAKSGVTLTAIKEVGDIAILEPIFMVADKKTKKSIDPLRIGQEGSIINSERILKELYTQFDSTFIKIPIGNIKKTNIPYYLVFKANELLHFSIVAIAGSGKGNALKILLLEYLYRLISRVFDEEQESIISHPMGIILFDDVGEYVKSLKPKDWGLNIPSVLINHKNKKKLSEKHLAMNDLILFCQVGTKEKQFEQFLSTPLDQKFSQLHPHYVPIEFIPVAEVLAKMPSNRAGSHLIYTYMNFYYHNEGEYFRPQDFRENRLSIEFLNWFLNVENHFKEEQKNDRHQYARTSYNMNVRILREFIDLNKQYLGIEWSRSLSGYHYREDLQENKIIVDKEGTSVLDNDGKELTKETLKDEFNLVKKSLKY